MDRYKVLVMVFCITSMLALIGSTPASSALIDVTIVGRQPTFSTSGVDFYFSLSLAATDAIHAGDQLKIPFLPWVGYDPGTAAAIVNQFQSTSGINLPPCGSVQSGVLCASTFGFGGPLLNDPSLVFVQTSFTPLSTAQLEALIVQCPACAATGNLGIVQPTFIYTATSDLIGPTDFIGFFQAHFDPTTNPPPAPVLCATAQLVGPGGNLLINAQGAPSLNEDCESLFLSPFGLGGPNVLAAMQLQPPFGFIPLGNDGGPPPACLGVPEAPNCALVALRAIPEPASISLLLLGLMTLVAMRRVSGVVT